MLERKAVSELKTLKEALTHFVGRIREKHAYLSLHHLKCAAPVLVRVNCTDNKTNDVGFE